MLFWNAQNISKKMHEMFPRIHKISPLKIYELISDIQKIFPKIHNLFYEIYKIFPERMNEMFLENIT